MFSILSRGHWRHRARSSLFKLVVAAVSSSTMTAAAQEPTQEFLVFPSAAYSDLAELSTPVLDDDDFLPTVDFFYSRSADRFRILGEFLLTDEEHELERLQFGWQLTDTTRLWLGRFHQSSSYWNTEFHHGQFMQTTISRPASEEFEDVGGILPFHTTGVQLEQGVPLGEGARVQMSFSAGLGGRLEEEEIVPFDLLDPESGHGSSVSFRVGYQPDLLGDDEIGLSYGEHKVNIEPGVTLPTAWPPGVDRIDLTTYGIYGDWSWARWRLIAAATAIESQHLGGTSSAASSRAVVSYAQIERQIKESFIVYARAEHTSGDEDYLEVFPAFVRRQSLGGARWLVGAKHALNIEFTNADLWSDHYHGVAVQWSAALP